jgi:hypothetical protein
MQLCEITKAWDDDWTTCEDKGCNHVSSNGATIAAAGQLHQKTLNREYLTTSQHAVSNHEHGSLTLHTTKNNQTAHCYRNEANKIVHSVNTAQNTNTTQNNKIAQRDPIHQSNYSATNVTRRICETDSRFNLYRSSNSQNNVVGSCYYRHWSDGSQLQDLSTLTNDTSIDAIPLGCPKLGIPPSASRLCEQLLPVFEKK